MDYESFERSLGDPQPPYGVSVLLQALWHERRGDWARAHEIAQDIESADAALVHAYLHRREGDVSNAGYWYRQAGAPIVRGDLDDEWRALVTRFLDHRGR